MHSTIALQSVEQRLVSILPLYFAGPGKTALEPRQAFHCLQRSAQRNGSISWQPTLEVAIQD
eukprot:5481158-Karenia_brevis.AAC.1